MKDNNKDQGKAFCDSAQNGDLNNGVREFLFKYATNSDPRYAVMLKGAWGCGKTHFVESWLSEYKQKCEDDENVIEPIYVTLFGMKAVSEITEAIDRKLHPILYSKGVDFAKRLLKVAGKIAFKTSLDVNKDGEDDVSFNASLDTLSLFGSKNSLAKFKLLVFDDFERCHIDKKSLLGYINNYVEHGACHIILIGDETHLTTDGKDIFYEFKEKTIGREFQIMPDVSAAVSCFLNEDFATNDFIKTQKALIIDVFQSSQYENLRVLRQSLNDYCTLYGELSQDVAKKGSFFLAGLLASFVAVYSEYKNGSRELLKSWGESYSYGLASEGTERKDISQLQNKYLSASERCKTEILNSSHIVQIVRYLETGISIKPYVEETIQQMLNGKPVQEELAEFYRLDQKTLKSKCSELTAKIKNGKVENLYQMGRSISILAYLDQVKIYQFPKKVAEAAKRYVIQNYELATDKDDLYRCRSAFYSGVNSYMQLNETAIGQKLLNSINSSFECREQKLPNQIENALNNLSDENVSKLIELSGSPTPDRRCQYNMTSVFKNCDPKKVSDGILNLSNSSKMTFCEFIGHHYMLSYRLGSGCNNFADDANVLNTIEEALNTAAKDIKGVDSYVLNKVSHYIEGAIKRANGDGDPIIV